MDKEWYQASAWSVISLYLPLLVTCGNGAYLPRLIRRCLPSLLPFRKRPLFLLLLFLFLAGFATPVSALDFNAYWLYRQSGGEDIDTRDEFQQRYSLSVGPGLTYRPSHAITASATVGYTGTRRDLGQGMESFDELNTSGYLSLVNDIFLAQLSGTITPDVFSSKFNRTTRSWDTTLSNRWDVPLWPKLTFNYGERSETFKLSDSTESFDEKSTNSSISMDWDLILAQLYYQYSTNKIEDMLSNNLLESDSHFVRFETDGSFWAQRMSYNFSQHFQHTTQDISFSDAVGGFFDFPIEGQTFAKTDLETDPDPPDLDYEDPGLSLPQTVDINERVHLSFITASTFPERIDLLRITLADSFTAQQALDLQWELYTKSDDFDQWELAVDETLQGEPVLDDENSIYISINLDVSEILLVAVNNTVSPLTFNAAEAFTLLTSAFSGSSTSYLTNFGLRYRITRSLTASGSVNVDHLESESENSNQERNQRTVNANLRWSPYTFLMPSLGYSEARETQTEKPEQINRNLSLTVATLPLPTMNVTYGITRGDWFIGGQKISTSMRYNIYMSALIYPDLKGNFDLSYRDTESLISDDLVTNKTALTSRFSLNALLRRYLTADFIINYRKGESETRSTENAETALSLIYRPSDLLGLRGLYTYPFLGENLQDRLTLGLFLGLISTYKTRLNFNANYSQAQKTSSNFGLDGSWDISRHLSLLTRAFYTIGDRDSYSVETSLTLRK